MISTTQNQIHTSMASKTFSRAFLILSCQTLPVFSLLAFFPQALNSCSELSRGWRNQLNLGKLPKCGQRAVQVSHKDSYQNIVPEIMDKLGHGSKFINNSKSVEYLCILYLLSQCAFKKIVTVARTSQNSIHLMQAFGFFSLCCKNVRCLLPCVQFLSPYF